MGITRERDGDDAEAHLLGWNAYRAGVAYNSERGHWWCQGWLAAAQEARLKIEAGSGLLEHRGAVEQALTDAYAAIRRLEGKMKIMPGDRSLLNNAAVKLGAVLAHFTAPADTERRLRGRA